MPDPALILVNLGTPAEPTAAGVRRFLKQFLSDRRVVNLPRLLWYPILYGIILPFRSPKVARLYEKIWWPEGSPLAVITQRQVQKLQAVVRQRHPGSPVRYAMVYGTPALADAVEALVAEGVEQAVVLPLYPQFCSATTGSVCDQLGNLRHRHAARIRLPLVKSYHDDERYIGALANSIAQHWRVHGRGEKLLFSFHGIPQALIDSGDPYFRQCHETAAAVAARLALAPGTWSVCFQSRFGKAEWAKPYTDHVIAALAGEGIRCVDVVTPAFASDCLETLEEIAVQNAELFRAAGGDTLRLVPCLNDSDEHIAVLAELFEKNLASPATA